MTDRAAGFTLIEVLAATLVLGMVGLLLSQGLTFGVRAQERHAALRTRKGDLEPVDRALRRLIAAADPGRYPEPATLRGQPHGMSFTTDLPLHGPSQLHGLGLLRRADVAVLVEGGQLLLSWRPHRHVAPFTPPPLPERTVLLDGVERLELAYQTATGVWRESWAGETLPTLVRLRLVFTDGSGRQWPPILAAPMREAAEP